MESRTTVGITVGDPAGIGPEVLEKALASVCESLAVPRLGAERPTFRLYGPAPVLDRLGAGMCQHRPGMSIDIERVPTSPDLSGIVCGTYSVESGAASIAALRAATADLATGRIHSLVTGPISKQAFADAGLEHPGQTEFVAQAMGCRDFAMMLGGPRLKVALVTTHLAVRDIAAAIDTDVVLSKLVVCHRFIRAFMGRPEPRIVVTGLNPHCGDNGRFGDEEARFIEPAVETARGMGMNVTGPLAADTVFPRAYAGEFDMVLAMYHDQGLGPLKLVHFNDAINVTMGLARIRCSPDHGPAWDIAGKGLADSSSMLAAVMFASGLKRD